MSRQSDLDELYGLLRALEEDQGGPHTVASPPLRRWPRHGVYFFFEPGELRADGVSPRCVRVGSHALTTTSRSTLPGRLRQHRGVIRTGGGNHRGSIFRGHVGSALIRRGDQTALPLEAWRAAQPDPVFRDAEHAVEQAVSRYIAAMNVVCLGVPTRSEGTSDRGRIESNAIALLSASLGHAIDAASPRWLGRWAPNPAIARSGLWNVNHADDADYDPAFLSPMAAYRTS